MAKLTDKLAEIKQTLEAIDDGCDESCGVCGDPYALRSGSDDTGLCDPCAQVIAAKYKPDIQYLLTQLEEAEKRERQLTASAQNVVQAIKEQNGPVSARVRMAIVNLKKLLALSAPETEEQK